ncbi:hypothetical protein F5X68DRAFT_230677 [Plectosphaerella plurivora]|uniref:Uncharacterized protein n=1 Tax=Plectosphaerella plurivora TaxID=936078 RepID=A0A9P9ABH4_9PEZI|nr:hypothetical protein F5X68DRAFT_230677 [Plectosphaerella plurivora]
MDFCEGFLQIPPDRGQILGRAVWKSRYVVIGKPNAHRQNPSHPSLAQVMTTSRVHTGPKTPSKANFPDEDFIALYKSRDDVEPAHMYPLSAVSDCQVQMVAHRKQGPVLPTLVISLNDKERKRRSSRATGLVANKDSGGATLMFRTLPDDHHISLQDWARFLISKKTPMSPESPASPSFINPFAPRSQTVDFLPRPSSGNTNSRSALLHKNSIAHSSRERPITFSSESPSLRSKRSDISSPSSATHHSPMGFTMPDLNKYTTVLPTDIPSPVTTLGDFHQGDFIEGWTSAQGRSSTLSSPIRGRGSVSSSGPPAISTISSSPPIPRETILDRAFQLKCIPGSENVIPGEEKLSSLARFDALMREAEDKRRQQQKPQRITPATQSAWDKDDSSDDEEDDVKADKNTYSFSKETDANRQTIIPPNAQRALEFLIGRHEPPPQPATKPPTSRSPATFHGPPPHAPSRPHTAHSKVRPSAGRTHSQPPLVPSPQERLDVLNAPPGKTSEDGNPRSGSEKRLSTSSAKRLSFTEFTKRLSSTSSLLLVQTNASAGSSRESSEYDRNPSPAPRGTLNARGAPPRPREADRCGFRPGFVEGGLF